MVDMLLVGKIQYVKMSFHHKLIYTFNKILINIPIGVFQNLKRIQSSFWAKSASLLNLKIKH